MVKVRDDYPRTEAGRIDVNVWCRRAMPNHNDPNTHLISESLLCAVERAEDIITPYSESVLEQSMAMAEIIAALNLDPASIAASILFPLLVYERIDVNAIHDQFTPEVAKLAEGAFRMNALTAYRQNKQDGGQLDKLRKMLLAMVEDARVVLIKLAEHLYYMRVVKHCGDEERQHMAVLARDIFAPLANRLGVGQIKWELEDLAFRYLEPVVYKRIARLLDERRVDRELYIKRVINTLEEALTTDHIKGDVQGRVKHIYSIWRKMQRKNIDYDQVYDVRALRILVDSVQECYSALGTVHRLWQHIPKEFDDYIATPKENGYQSLHTAVVGPEGKAIEVQIRTKQMHQDSELGVAAHWRYKEGVQHDSTYEEKIAWLRQLLEWQEEMADATGLLDELKTKVIDERVYVLTPKGDVLDLPTGSTPLDFAYAIHSSIGHRCRGAKINGRIVQLTYPLKTGEKVEIITGAHENPSRDWLNTNLGYVKSSRSRGKIQSWFKHQDKGRNIAEGRLILDRELQRLGIDLISLDQIASKLNLHHADDVLAALSTGDVRFHQILNASGVAIPSKGEQAVIPLSSSAPKSRPKSAPEEITIQGVGNLLITLAHCCKPLPGDPIIGYITQGRGVTVHRQDCANLTHVSSHREERLVQVEWGGTEKTYPVDIIIYSYDRTNLLRDITACLANDAVNVVSLHSSTDRTLSQVTTRLCIEITDLNRLSKVLDRLYQLPNVIDVKRQD